MMIQLRALSCMILEDFKKFEVLEVVWKELQRTLCFLGFLC